MEVITLNSTNFIGLSAAYTHDNTIKFDHEVYKTEQGVSLPLSPVFANANDTATNNYSNLFLTQTTPIPSVAYIEDLEPIFDGGFTTFLAVNATGGISDASRYLVVQEPDIAVNTATISVSGVRSKIDNRYFFTIIFLDQNLCKVEHINGSIKRYLTLDIQDNIFFSFDVNLDYLGELSPQIFYYTYDRDNNFIVFSKNILDTERYVSYRSSDASLVTVSPITGANTIPFTSDSIFACTPRPEQPNNTKLVDPWVSYNLNFKTNTQDININRSTKDVNTNLLVNSEYSNVTGTALNINALSLKNTSTPENYQSRNNPFQSNKSNYTTEDDIEFREYKKLFTGSNQILGNDNITLGYESYTTDIVLPKDSVTYFHVPQVLYPFSRLNINESGLVEAGAIAGDHPIKSDKIFKKLANAKSTSPFGSVSDEANGSFLCSWLSGSSDLSVKPTWVDRYYNPSKITFINALTSRSLKAISYESAFEDLVLRAGNIPGTDDVFDKPSDLIFEPGCYYAYHHYGPKDVSKFIQTFTPFLVEEGLDNYFFSNGSSAESSIQNNEYSFDGNTYAITNPLSSIQLSNQFTLAFDMYNADWSKPFGYQVIGNFLNDGFGIFNENIVTPTVLVNTVSSLDILNTDLRKLKTITYSAQPLAFIRSNFGENYSIVFSDGFIRQYTCDDNLLRQSYSSYLANTIDYTNNETTAFVLCSGSPTIRVLQVDLASSTLTPINTATVDKQFTPNAGSFSNNLAKTIDVYNNSFYFTEGSTSRRVGNKIYYLTDNNKTIVEWNEINSTAMALSSAFKISSTNATSNITDFNIDFDSNIWILQNNNTYYKYTQDREFLLSGTLTSSTSSVNTVSLTGSGKHHTYAISNSGSTSSYDYTVFINNSQLRPVFDFNIINNKIVFLTQPLSGDNIVISRLVYQDTFKNHKINFISEFVNGEYIDNVLISRTGYLKTATTTTTTTAQAYQFIVLNTSGTQISNAFYTTLTGNPAFTNTNYLREYIQDAYSSANLNVKAVARNVYNDTDLLTSEIKFNLSALDPGYHHFAVRFDTYHGFMSLFVDGQRVNDVQFAPRKYKFSNLLYRPFLVGSACFNNSTPLFKYLQKNTYLVENTKIRNFYLYNTPLNDYDIIMHARESCDIHDIHFDIPCGRRNYLEEIERYFKATTPGSKSTQYNIVIRNTGIVDDKLRTALEKRIAIALAKSAPVYSKLNKIKWVN